ncbi:MAG TPA: hypothetical protein VGA61_14245, partial [Anaerolineae bacterium]
MEFPRRTKAPLSPWLIAYLAVLVLLLAIAAVLAFQRGVRASGKGSTPVAAGLAPSIQLDPGAGGPGTAITITGRGWREADSLFIRIEDPGSRVSDQVSAYALGTVPPGDEFTAQFTFPSDPAFTSSSYVTLTVWSPLSGDRASRPFLLQGRPGQGGDLAGAAPAAQPTAFVATSTPRPLNR